MKAAQENRNASSVIAAFVSGIVKASAKLDLDASWALKESQLSEQQLIDPTARIPTEQLVVLLQSLANQYGADSIGLQLAKGLHPGCFSALGYAVASCRTLGDAVKLIPKYESVVLSGCNTEVIQQPDQAILQWHMVGKTQSRLIEDVFLAARLHLARTFTGQMLRPREVRLTYKPTNSLEQFQEFYGCKIRFNQPRSAMVFGLKVLAQPVAHADPFINRLMQNQAYELKQGLVGENSFEQQVRSLLEEQLPKGLPEQSAIAQNLNVSERTLRRRLQVENSTYQQVLEDLRKQKADYYLQKTSLSILEISLLLGYSEHSAFSAAFKRWHNITPAEVRAATGSAT